MPSGLPANTGRKWGDHMLTYLAEGLVMIGTIVVYRLAALQFGEEGFSVYAVVRRTTSFILPFAMMGMAVTVVRHVAMATDEAQRWGIVRAAGLLLLAVAAAVTMLFLLFPSRLSYLIFGEHGMSPFALPIGAMVLGQLMHSLLYSYWRGAQRMVQANALQVLNLGFVPVVAFLIAGSLLEVLRLTAALWVLFSVLPFAWLLVRNTKLEPARGQLRGLLRYGLPRVPGDLALAALLTLPVYVINHTEGLDSGGQVAFGLTLLNMVGALFAPISLLMLPSVAHALARNDKPAVVREVQRTRNGTLIIAAVVVLVFQLLATPVLNWYVGEENPALVETCRILFSAALFLALFISLRSLLDAYFVQARNSINILWALGLFLVGAMVHLFLWPHRFVLLAMVPISLLLLALLTWRDVQGVLKKLGNADVSLPRNVAPNASAS